MSSIAPGTRVSTCALDCPDACSVLVSIGADGRATSLRGNPDHPVTRGFLCAKVAQYLERQYHPDRLRHPMRRVGAKGDGRFERIGWDDALDEIAGRLMAIAREWGPEAVLPYSYGGSMGLLQGNGMDRRFFHRFGASRLDRTICSAAGTAGLAQTIGYRYGTEPEQFAHSKLILAWGANILGTNVHLWPFIVEARRRGARFYTIDPVLRRTGRLADKHFFVNPGSDLALVLGMAHVIIGESLHDAGYVARHTTNFDRLKATAARYTPEHAEALTGIPREEIVALAREYATTRPAVIRLNYGTSRSERGGMAFSAVAMLPALTGSWKEVGGGLQASVSQTHQFNRAAIERADLQMKSPLGREARLVNMITLGHALTELNDPPVKAMFVYCSNPAAVAPNQSAVRRGLRRDDLFTVVHDQFQTDTADFADLLLPATTFLEHTDLYSSYGHLHVQMARPALEPEGEARSNVQLFRDLAARLGFDDQAFGDTEDDMIRTALASGHEFLKGITLEALEQRHHIRLNVAPDGQPFLPFAEGNFGSPGGQCDLAPEGMDYTPPLESRHGDSALLRRYPLELVSPKNDDSMNSTFGYRASVDEQTARLWMHAADAGARGILDGDLVRVFNERGSMRLTASVNGHVRPGAVCAPSVRMPRMAPDGSSSNFLTSERLSDIGGGATFYSCLVQVERCGD
ncbi:MAG: molybdopterin-dependent oxidoreductase [Bryobacterales bacterium]|nr:molybdopterin-dependent oxidoreductase [Bryobacterales bacterium]